jgi:hypothetical protein
MLLIIDIPFSEIIGIIIDNDNILIPTKSTYIILVDI